MKKRKRHYEDNKDIIIKKNIISNKKAFVLKKDIILEKSRNYYKKNKKQICAKQRKVYFDLKKKYCDLDSDKQKLIKNKNTVAKKIKKNTR